MTDAHARAEAFWRYAWLTLSDDNLNVEKLRIPLPFAMMLLGGIVTTLGGMWTITSGLRSDVRDILTHMTMQRQIDEGQAKIQEERANAMRESIDAMKRRQELQQYEIQGLKELMLKQEKR
jgi:hypothetical protein